MTLLDKYKGQEVDWDTIFKDDFMPMIKEKLTQNENQREVIFEAFMSLGLQVPFSETLPFDFIEKARGELIKDAA